MNMQHFDGFNLWTSETAASYLGKSPSWLRGNHLRLGIPSFKVGNQLRFRKAQIDAWLDEQIALTGSNSQLPEKLSTLINSSKGR